MNRPMEDTPAVVPEAKQAGDIRARWAWVEPAVWTDRMLAALEQGVKGGTWFSLIDKVYTKSSLAKAWQRVRENKGAAGVDRQTIEMFERHLDENLENLARTLREGSYRPQPIRRVWIPKPGSTEQRPLGIPTVQDRVVQTALRNALEPIFERDFAEHSYGFRPGRGCKDALRRVDGLLKAGHAFVVDADLRSYFDTIPHPRLLERLKAKVTDGRIIALLEAYLAQEVPEAMNRWTPAEGTPQGAVISPLLSNIYLDPLDHLLAGEGLEMVRYADDFVILCRTRQEAGRALALVERWTAQAGLTLHPDKTHIVNACQPGGFDFLGYRFEQGRRWPRKKSLDKLKSALRGKLPRNSGTSLDGIVSDVNRTLRGWFEYFKHSRRFTFQRLDGWIGMRLRSILRRRQHLRGRGRGRDRNRWPNAFFAAHGLFSLTAAHAAARQSSWR